MKLRMLGAAFTSALLLLPTLVLAQSATERAADTAAQPLQQPTSEQKKDDSASMGSSATATQTEKTFTHGESKRCESMTGTDKDQCDKEEGTKTQGPAAQEASKPDSSEK